MEKLIIPDVVDIPALRGLSQDIDTEIIGQERARDEIIDSFGTAMAGLNPPNTPIVTLIFLGPTGVGKTEIAKVVGRYFFRKFSPAIKQYEAAIQQTADQERSGQLRNFRMPEIMRVDCGRYGGSMGHATIELLGPPVSYIGWGHVPVFSPLHFPPVIIRVLLLDEIEKAFIDARDAGAELKGILMPVLRDARIQNNRGEEVSFVYTIIICTSNFGSAAIVQEVNKRKMGFRLNSHNDKGTHLSIEHVEKLNQNIYEMIRDKIRDPKTSPFPTELLNRFDRIVVFRFLTLEEYRRVLDKEIAMLNQQFALGSGGILLKATPEAKEWILHHGIDVEHNVPSLQRFIKRKIRDPISKLILDKQVKPGDILEAHPGPEDELVFGKTKSDLEK